MTISHIGFGRARAALCIVDKIMLMGCCALMLHSYKTWNMGCSVSSGKVVISTIRIKIAVGPASSVERGEGEKAWKKRPVDCVLVVGDCALLLWYTILILRSSSYMTMSASRNFRVSRTGTIFSCRSATAISCSYRHACMNRMVNSRIRCSWSRVLAATRMVPSSAYLVMSSLALGPNLEMHLEITGAIWCSSYAR